MKPDPAIEPEIAEAAERALLAAVTDLLEVGVELCAAANAVASMPTVVVICRDVLALGAAIEVVSRRKTP